VFRVISGISARNVFTDVRAVRRTTSAVGITDDKTWQAIAKAARLAWEGAFSLDRLRGPIDEIVADADSARRRAE
jgi:hypothetical protein